MTGRERLSRGKRWATVGVVAGIVLIVAGVSLLPVLAGQGVDGFAMTAVTVPGVVAFVGTVIAVQKLLFRCPWCRGNMGALLSQRGLWRIDPKVRFCPFCGTDLDEPVGAAGWDDPVE